MKGITAETEALKEYKRLEPNYIERVSGANYDSEKKYFTLAFCKEKYRITYPEGKVSYELFPEKGVPEIERTIILQYLAFACGLPKRGFWLTFLELPDGAHHNAPFQIEACNILAQTFGYNLEAFLEIGKSFGGEKLEMGDVAFRLQVLPKIDLAFVLWEGDEEFPAKANVLFEGVTPTYLTTAWLYCLGIEVAQKLIKSFQREVD